ncbi:hypothetical protein [Acinetobacter johnsonii]|uniref:hypothetical protein n=1 Tax=Acinetobacter johnsonii TaxID=40214 RepID=UPI0022E6F21E|nr:hypothetical protein [Acinetobacter johnsonii]
MDIQKEREAFKQHLTDTGLVEFAGYGFAVDECDEYLHEPTQVAWDSWLIGLNRAKAQAVPEGYVLVKKVHPDAIVHNQGLGLFKECQVIYGWDGKSKDFKEALNKGFYHGVKLGAKAVLETAMIEAQEQTHD